MNSSLRPGFILGLIASASVLLFGPASALADTTHPFLEYINTTSGGNVQPEAVDHSGNLIVWQGEQRTVAKFNPNGNPVNFSALGTNEIDGKGGFNCPATPGDCDRIPTNGFMPATGQEGNDVYRAVAVDNSGGPADGYIYVANNERSVNYQGEPTGGEVDVFDATGEFLGTINQDQTSPETRGNESSTIWVDSAGVLYIDHWEFHEASHVDRYVPVDGNPAHDQFSGQIRTGFGSMEGVAAGLKYAYTLGFDGQHVEYPGPFPSHARYPQSEFHHPRLAEKSLSDVFPPGLSGPFGSFGEHVDLCGCRLPILYVDSLDEHVYLGGSGAGFVEFDLENHQVGPRFAGDGCSGGPPPCHIGSVQAIAIDRSGGPHEGRIYIHGPGSNQIAVFGPPVVIPDVTYGPVTIGHTTAEVSGTIGLAGGPPTTDCHIEWGEVDPGNLTYPNSTPCSPAGGYSGDTSISATLGGLEIGRNYRYRIVAENPNGRNAGNDHVVTPVAVLGVTTEAATNLSPTGATLNGSLNPDGLDTEYHYEYGLGTNYPESTTPVGAPSDSNQVALPPISIEDLQRGRTYHYRLAATNSLGTTYGEDRTLVVPRTPEVTGLYTTNVRVDGAEIHARINSFGYDTSYVVEYGTSPEYGSSVPPVDIGSDESPQAVSAQLSSLEPGRPYHFRIVATNKWGTSASVDSTVDFLPPVCPNSHVRQQTNGNYLPDCRAYELVSPSDAGASQLFPGNVTIGISNGEQGVNLGLQYVAPNSGMAQSPSRFGYFAGEGSIAGLHPPNTLIDRYVATRTSNGWVTTYPGRTGDQTFIAVDPACNQALDICVDYRYLDFFYSSNTYPPLGEPTASKAPYAWDVSGKSLGRWPTNLDQVAGGDQYVGDTKTSGDFRHFAFSSRNVAFTSDGLTTAPGSAYDNDTTARTVTLISKLPNGEPLPQEPGAAGGPEEFIKFRGVSTDGSHILMSTSASPVCFQNFSCPSNATTPVHLYMRVGDGVTYDVSQGQAVAFVGMTKDGSRVYFMSTARLSAGDTDSSNDLYVWSEQAQSVALVSTGNGKGNTDACNAPWTSGCGVASLVTERPDTDNFVALDSGDIYFYSPEQLDADNPGIRNERNLYVLHAGTVRYVTTFEPNTQADRIQVSPDGDHMAFLTRSRITSYDNDGWQEMYTYDPAIGEIRCASCLPSGEPPTTPHEDPRQKHPGKIMDAAASKSGPFMSDDGRVAFSTSDALVSSDTNRNLDVYEFVEGRPRLITAGTGDRTIVAAALFYPGVDIGLESFSADGVDLFFSTFDTLVPQDRNGSFVKFYDARTGGGFPSPPPTLPCTAADECHGEGSVAPPPLQSGTSGALGSGGNMKEGRKHARRKHRGRKRRRQKHRQGQHQRSSQEHGNG